MSLLKYQMTRREPRVVFALLVCVSLSCAKTGAEPVHQRADDIISKVAETADSIRSLREERLESSRSEGGPSPDSSLRKDSVETRIQHHDDYYEKKTVYPSGSERMPLEVEYFFYQRRLYRRDSVTGLSWIELSTNSPGWYGKSASRMQEGNLASFYRLYRLPIPYPESIGWTMDPAESTEQDALHVRGFTSGEINAAFHEVGDRYTVNIELSIDADRLLLESAWTTIHYYLKDRLVHTTEIKSKYSLFNDSQLPSPPP